MNKPDSAKYYLKISLGNTNNSTNIITGYQAGALIARDAGNYRKAYYLLEKAYGNRDSVYQLNIRSQLYRIDKQYDLSEKEKENSDLTIANRTKLIWIAVLIIAVLVAFIIVMLFINRYKKQKMIHANKLQILEFEKETVRINNKQKQEIIYLNLNNKIENTLRFNKIKRGILQKENKDSFVLEITLSLIHI